MRMIVGWVKCEFLTFVGDFVGITFKLGLRSCLIKGSHFLVNILILLDIRIVDYFLGASCVIHVGVV